MIAVEEAVKTPADDVPAWATPAGAAHVTQPSLDDAVLSSRIVVVDDDVAAAKLIEVRLREMGYTDVLRVDDPVDAIVHVGSMRPDLVLLDVVMAGITGLDVLEAIRSDADCRHIPVIMMTASTDRDVHLRALEVGATDFLHKPLDFAVLKLRVRNVLLLKANQDKLERLVEARTAELRESQLEVLHCLARAGEFRDDDTGRHVMRVRKYVAIIARQLGLDRSRVELISLASTLHDVGKIGVPDAVLLKPDRLTAEEFELIKEHCRYGAVICSGISRDGVQHRDEPILSTGRYQSPLLRTASVIAATHHEKWDGTGYPRGLRGEEIPLEGRITAVADVFDALGSRRPYKEPFPLEKCLAVIREGRGTHFDPAVVDAFFDALDEILHVRRRYADE